MAKDLIGFDPSTGTSTIFHEEDGGDTVYVEERQDVTPILKQNREFQNSHINRKAEMRHAATIPLPVYQEWEKEFKRTRGTALSRAPQQERDKFLKAKLNDRDNRMWRTWLGNL